MKEIGPIKPRKWGKLIVPGKGECLARKIQSNPDGTIVLELENGDRVTIAVKGTMPIGVGK